jgi:hypothetical protein
MIRLVSQQASNFTKETKDVPVEQYPIQLSRILSFTSEMVLRAESIIA